MSIHETFSIMEKPIDWKQVLSDQRKTVVGTALDPREVTILQRVTPGNILFLQDIRE
jgi:RNA-binding protein YlmH